MLARIAKRLTSGRPGPMLLSLPEDVLDVEIESDDAPVHAPVAGVERCVVRPAHADEHTGVEARREPACPPERRGGVVARSQHQEGWGALAVEDPPDSGPGRSFAPALLSPDATAGGSEAAGTQAGASSEGGDPAQATDFSACQVTDTGGVDDRSFNQTAYKGLQDAEEEFGIQTSVLESESDADF